ncbi:MAG TPA: hypothetical protein DCE78_08060, partial [Bacteroidetes bacterium]|nr:hypothetical protein [Bacteroidota bacterium]
MRIKTSRIHPAHRMIGRSMKINILSILTVCAIIIAGFNEPLLAKNNMNSETGFDDTQVQERGTISGRVTDANNNEPII